MKRRRNEVTRVSRLSVGKAKKKKKTNDNILNGILRDRILLFISRERI